MSKDENVMGRWMEESLAALAHLRRLRDQHERALEAAMEAIRRHTDIVEQVERDIAVIEAAVSQTSGDTPPAPEIIEEERSDTRVHYVGSVKPPSPPPLRPVVPLPTAVGQS
ncbi:MAG: hypothetical protein K0V04_23040 [Deltaproteobacteria bacterium]|nr:hypothetical protein [Deltaproteobacteria bacterium]